MVSTNDMSPFGLVEAIRSKPRALRVGELAALLAVSDRQIYALAAQHRIPGSFRIGGSLRFDPIAIAIWLRQKMTTANDAAAPNGALTGR